MQIQILNSLLAGCIILLFSTTCACNEKRNSDIPHDDGLATAIPKSDSVTARTADNIKVSVQLRDGSRIIGYPLSDSITIQAQYARLSIAFRLIRVIELGPTGAQATTSLANGERLQGSLLPETFRIRSLVGTIPIAFKDVSSLTVLTEYIPADSDLVAFYPFDGNARDMSGHDHHGTIMGAKLCNDRFGISDKAYFFDGNESYISIPDGLLLYDMPEFSISAWLLAANLIKHRIAIYFGAATGEAQIYLADGQIVFSVDLGKWYELRSEFSLNTWVHVTGVYRRGQGTELWIDGEKKAQMAIPAGDLLHGLQTINSSIGSYAPEHFNHSRANNIGTWLGAIDQIRVYKRALGPEEIRKLHDSDR